MLTLLIVLLARVLHSNMFGMAAFTAPLQRLSFLAITGSAVCSLFEDLPQLVVRAARRESHTLSCRRPSLTTFVCFGCS